MTQIQQRLAGKAGRGDGAYGNVRAGQKQNTRRCADPTPTYRPVFARPPAILPPLRARHVPDLLRLYVDDDWKTQLADAKHELERYGETIPACALPLNTDPVAYRWPAAGRNVAIYGTLDRVTLRRLLAALLRDGAAVAAGVDQHGVLHTAVPQAGREAA
jgi:hypothetical protein